MMNRSGKSLLFRVFLVLASMAISSVLRAQAVEIAPFGGWQFGGGFGTREGHVDINADVVYGASVDVRVREDGLLEFVYSRQDASLEIRSDDPFDPFLINKRTVDASVEYYQGGGVFEFEVDNPSVRPFVALTAGATRLRAEGESEWWFSMGGGVGLKVFFSDRWGIRIDARAWPTFLRGGGNFLCSLPGGCLVGFDTSASWQGSATAGVILGF